MDEDGVTRTTRFDEWPDDGVDLLLRLAGWFSQNAWLVSELPPYDHDQPERDTPDALMRSYTRSRRAA